MIYCPAQEQYQKNCVIEKKAKRYFVKEVYFQKITFSFEQILSQSFVYIELIRNT